MPLPTNRVDGQPISAADLNAISEGVNDAGILDLSALEVAANEATAAAEAATVSATEAAEAVAPLVVEVETLTTTVAGKEDEGVAAALVAPVAAAVAAKADASALTSGLAAKADAATVTASLATKADASALTSGLAAKADTAALTAKLDATDPAVVTNLSTAIDTVSGGDLFLATGNVVGGTVTGGVVREATAVHVPWVRNQTATPTDKAIGTAFNVDWQSTISGSAQSQTGWFGPRPVYNLEGVVRYAVNQGPFAFEPIGMGDLLRVANTAGVARTITPAWSFMSSRMIIADGALVSLSQNDTNKGGAAFANTKAYVTINGGSIADATGDSMVGFMDAPVIAGNVSLNRRVGYQAQELKIDPVINAILDSASGAPPLVGNVDTFGSESVVEQIGFHAWPMNTATWNIGVQNEAATVESPQTATLANAAATIPIDSTVVFLNNTSGGPLTLTGAPTIRDGRSGQRLTLINITSNVAHLITLRGENVVAGSNLQATRILNKYASVTLSWNETASMWTEIAASDSVQMTVHSGTIHTTVGNAGLSTFLNHGDGQSTVAVAALLSTPFVSMGVGGSTASDLFLQRGGTDGTLSVSSSFAMSAGTGAGYVLAGHKHTARVITAASDTLVAADGPKALNYNRATAIAAGLPGTSVSIPANVRIPVANFGAGTVTFAGSGTGVLVAGSPTTLTQGQGGWLLKPDATNLNLWMLIRS